VSSAPIAEAAPGRHPASIESLLFAVAAAMIAAHAVVDSFLFLQPGVSPADHLVPGLLPPAILAVAAVVFPRLRAGLAAAIALVLGALALVGFAVVVSGARADGVSGSDWTGFLLGPAGAVLLALGVRMLWRTRRRDGGRARRIVRRAVLAVAAALVLYWVVVPAGLALVATHRPRDVGPVADLGRAHEEVVVRTADGLDLWGQYVPPENAAVVIVLPVEWTTDHARMLVAAGYGVLALDPRGYGRSEGDPNAYGWAASRDVDAAVAWLRGRPEVDGDRVGGLGLSIGGEVTVEAAAGGDGLAAVVCEGAGIRSVREALVREGPSAIELALQYPMDLVQTVATAVFSGDAPPPSLRDLAATVTPAALFLLYGENGQAVEETVNVPYFEAAGEPKELWEVPGAAHTGGLEAQPGEYERRVVGFFDRHLLGE
jgi:uncharacterized protein